MKSIKLNNLELFSLLWWFMAIPVFDINILYGIIIPNIYFQIKVIVNIILYRNENL